MPSLWSALSKAWQRLQKASGVTDAAKTAAPKPHPRSFVDILAEKRASSKAPSDHERLLRAINALSPGNPEGIEVDWTQAPSDTVEWRFDERSKRAYWLNGKSRIEEWGQVWESKPAPCFGATTAAKIKLTEEGLRRAQLQKLQEKVPGPDPDFPAPPRRRM